MIKTRKSLALAALSIAFLAAGALSAAVPVLAAEERAPSAQDVLAIKSIRAVEAGGASTLRLSLSRPLTSLPRFSRISNPDRIMFDLPGVVNGTGKRAHDLSSNGFKNISLVQSDGMTRVIAGLRDYTDFRIDADGDDLVLYVGEKSAPAVARTLGQGDTFSMQAVTALDFRRGPAGEGRIIFDLSDNSTAAEVKQQGSQLLIDFPSATAADQLLRRMNVADFGTPVKAITMSRSGKGMRMVVEPTGLWEFNSYQTDNRFVVEIRPVAFDPNKLVQGTSGGYKGERMTLNFQNIDVRSLLNVIADFTKLNIVAADNVQGMMTIRLQDVPWDQALDMVLQTRNLDMRKNGNVIWVAPRDEINKAEKDRLEASAQTSDLEAVRTEGFVLNYTRAEDVVKLLGDAKQRILSKRGSVVLDARTNQIFVQDTGLKLDEVRGILAKIDIPVRQVQIEARIVEANDKFSRSIGARLGFASVGTRSLVTPSNETSYYQLDRTNPVPTLDQRQNVNLPAAALESGNPVATISTVLMNSAGTRFLNLELSALEADGRGKIVSSPSVVTADQEKALIEQGTELPYLEASSSGAATVSFKKANLKLEVTPQITPDGNVIMSVDINKDAPGTQTTSGFAIDTKHVKTKVLVENGGTVVIGGIFSQDERNSVSKVPFLGDLPVVGNAFKTTTRQDTKTELLVFLTPRILDSRIGASK